MFLEIHELRKSFGAGENRTEVLKGLDFSVEKGEICVLLGPSGSGKSTLLNIIGGIDEADGGYISINGEKRIIATIAPNTSTIRFISIFAVLVKGTCRILMTAKPPRSSRYGLLGMTLL